YGFFLQDDFRAARSLTLNLGVRYDAQAMKQGPTRNPSPSLAAAGIDTSRINNDYNNFAPRFGFAWSPSKSDRLVVRGGYGLFYGRTPSIALGTAHSNNGLNSVSITLTNPTGLVYPFRFASIAHILSRGWAPSGGESFYLRTRLPTALHHARQPGRRIWADERPFFRRLVSFGPRSSPAADAGHQSVGPGGDADYGRDRLDLPALPRNNQPDAA